MAGLLRDRHDGIDAVRKLCAYANSKGVKICIIGGLFAYGGAYYEGKSKWSLDRFLEDNKDCMVMVLDFVRNMFSFSGLVGFGGRCNGQDACSTGAPLPPAWIVAMIRVVGKSAMDRFYTNLSRKYNRRRGDL